MKFMYLIFLLVLISCQSNEEVVLQKMYGQWAIDKIEYKGENYTGKLYSNVFFIEENFIFSLPSTFDFEAEKGIWTMVRTNKLGLKIDCKNDVFNGDYKVKFIKDYDKKLLGIDLKSEKTHIIAYKFLQNFEIDGKWW